jgi:hypothetical protein
VACAGRLRAEMLVAMFMVGPCVSKDKESQLIAPRAAARQRCFPRMVREVMAISLAPHQGLGHCVASLAVFRILHKGVPHKNIHI